MTRVRRVAEVAVGVLSALVVFLGVPAALAGLLGMPVPRVDGHLALFGTRHGVFDAVDVAAWALWVCLSHRSCTPWLPRSRGGRWRRRWGDRMVEVMAAPIAAAVLTVVPWAPGAAGASGVTGASRRFGSRGRLPSPCSPPRPSPPPRPRPRPRPRPGGRHHTGTASSHPASHSRSSPNASSATAATGRSWPTTTWAGSWPTAAVWSTPTWSGRDGRWRWQPPAGPAPPTRSDLGRGGPTRSPCPSWWRLAWHGGCGGGGAPGPTSASCLTASNVRRGPVLARAGSPAAEEVAGLLPRFAGSPALDLLATANHELGHLLNQVGAPGAEVPARLVRCRPRRGRPLAGPSRLHGTAGGVVQTGGPCVGTGPTSWAGSPTPRHRPSCGVPARPGG